MRKHGCHLEAARNGAEEENAKVAVVATDLATDGANESARCF